MKILLESDVNSFLDALVLKLKGVENVDPHRVFEALSWLGVFSLSEPFNLVTTSSNTSSGLTKIRPQSLLDAFCALLQRKLAFKEDERDLVILTHKFIVEFPSASKNIANSGTISGDLSTNILQEHTCSLVMYGDSIHSDVSKYKFSAMAKTVGYPVALAAEVLLKTPKLEKSRDSFSEDSLPFGVLLPTHKAIYEPILKACPSLGIYFKEIIERTPTLFH